MRGNLSCVVPEQQVLVVVLDCMNNTSSDVQLNWPGRLNVRYQIVHDGCPWHA